MALRRLLDEIAARCPKGQLPESYLVFDTETSGVDPYNDCVLQFGFCIAHQRRVADRFGYIVKRPPNLVIAPEAVRVHGIDHARMDKEGLPPVELLNLILDTLEAFRSNGLMYVGHNMINFDAPFLERESAAIGRPFKFGPNEILDTGMLVKAARMGMYFNRDDTLRSFSKRVSEVRAKGIYWSLDRYCFDTYGLGAASGIKKEDAHDASVDCLLTHHLLERLREICAKEAALA
jgi:DNA polymerase III epsilon subunit-like protein